MEITLSEEQARVPVTVLQINSELTAETDAEFIERVQKAHEDGMRYLLLDLGQASFVSSAGLRAIHHVFSLLRGDSSSAGDNAVMDGIRTGSYRSSHLKLLDPNPDVLNALKAAGFDMFLDIYADRETALAAF